MQSGNGNGSFYPLEMLSIYYCQKEMDPITTTYRQQHSGAIEPIASGVRLPGFKHQLYHLPTV